MSTVCLQLPLAEGAEECKGYWREQQPLVTQQPPRLHMQAPSLIELNLKSARYLPRTSHPQAVRHGSSSSLPWARADRQIVVAQEKEKEWNNLELKAERAAIGDKVAHMCLPSVKPVYTCTSYLRPRWPRLSELANGGASPRRIRRPPRWPHSKRT